jgi:O-antigen ligase
MPRQLILAGFVGFILWLFVRDVRRRPSVSTASWLVVVWAVIFASRPVSGWFQSGAVASVESYAEGSPVDRAVFTALILAGYAVLIKRRIPLGRIVANNRWLFAFYGFWLVSISWSDLPFVAFKRLFKDFGSVVMVIVLLTDRDPVETVKAVFVRAAYLLVPMSVLFVRFYPEIGRAYTGYNMDDLMYVGVATHKNTLGALLLASCLFLMWDLFDKGARSARISFVRADTLVVLVMALWLLRIADSATALLCTGFGVTLWVVSGFKTTRRLMPFAEVLAVGLALAWYLADSVFHISELVVSSVGRDMTLTTRTDAWQLFFQLGTNPLVGAGFKSFWAGDRMARIWVDFPGIVQAHNGYIETYLEGGFVGLALLAAMLLFGLQGIKQGVCRGDSFARLRLAFFGVTLFYNFSEAAFTQLSLLWLVTLLVVTEAPALVPAKGMAELRSPGSRTHPGGLQHRSAWQPPRRRSGEPASSLAQARARRTR